MGGEKCAHVIHIVRTEGWVEHKEEPNREREGERERVRERERRTHPRAHTYTTVHPLVAPLIPLVRYDMTSSCEHVDMSVRTSLSARCGVARMQTYKLFQER